MSRGCLIMNKGRMIVIGKNSLQVKFNNEIETNSSFVCGAVWAVKSENDYLLATVAMANRHRPHDINNLHKKLGHMSKTLIKTAKFYNWLLIENQFKTCESCILAKLCQKDTNKEKKACSKTPGKWLFIDISHIKTKALVAHSIGCLPLTMQWTLASVYFWHAIIFP